MTAMCSSKSSSDHGRIRTETKSSWFCMVGPRQAVYMVTAVLVHLTYLVSYYLRWQLYSAVPQFPVFWPSEMTSATFCESSPTVQSRVQSTEYRRPAAGTLLLGLWLSGVGDHRRCDVTAAAKLSHLSREPSGRVISCHPPSYTRI